MAVRRLEIVIPSQIWDKLEKIERKTGITKEDLVMRGLVKVMEEFERG